MSTIEKVIESIKTMIQNPLSKRGWQLSIHHCESEIALFADGIDVGEENLIVFVGPERREELGHFSTDGGL